MAVLDESNGLAKANGSVQTPSYTTEETNHEEQHEYMKNKDDGNDRATWGKKIEFMLSAVSYAVGLGNVWRFPHLCYTNGGGAFLFPYVFMLVFAGLPLFYLELAFGQYASLGPLTIWRVSPVFKGLGYTMMFSCLIVSIYYNVILALTFFYFFASFTTELPWAKCGHWWNTDHCLERIHHHGYYIVNNTTPGTNSSDYFNNTSPRPEATLPPEDRGHHANNTIHQTWPANVTSPAEEFWKYYVLGVEDDTNIGNLGNLQWKLTLCLFIAWIVVYLCIAKGIKTSGKVVYFTATFPYIVLTVLLLRGVTLDGAAKGIKFYLTPDFRKMAHAKVWKDAAVQIFYSLGVGFGTLLTLGSYNKFNNNCHKDAIIVAFINCGTSIFAGFVIFSVLGYMAHESNLSVDKVVEKGPGLAFIAYPEALAMLPGAPFWSIAFFFMLMTLGLGSQFPSMECVMTGFTDEFPVLRPYKTWLTMGLCGLLFIFGLPCVTKGGMYVVELMDTFTTSFPLLFVAFSECVVLNWVYGYKRFSDDIELMMGFRPNYYWVACWLGITPTIIFFVLVSSCIEYSGLEYNGYIYPTWAEFIGWLLVVAALGMIPLWAFIKFWQLVGSCHNFCWLFRGVSAIKTLDLISLIRPSEDWGPALQENKDKVQQVKYNREQDMVNILDITSLEEGATDDGVKGSAQTDNDENKTLNATIQGVTKYTTPGGESYI